MFPVALSCLVDYWPGVLQGHHQGPVANLRSPATVSIAGAVLQEYINTPGRRTASHRSGRRRLRTGSPNRLEIEMDARLRARIAFPAAACR
ncbi:MAG TPA: hypothetical protein VGL00_18180, partial [Terracidiphilus sp.]